ncbi:MAG TPA: hypothetical protein VFY91_09650 [Microbacterium sp.]|nr:hypothetical protein [Microbacterium sp.]
MATPSSDIPPDGAVPVIETAKPPSDGAWRRSLPLRFNPPPGWPTPGHDWILRHIGLEMCDAWRPDGAPRSDPEGWLWWVPQEPAWTAWVEQEARRFRMLPWLVGVFATSVVILGATLPTEGAALLLIPAAMGSGLGAIVLVAQHRHFMKDPVGRFREEDMELWRYRTSVNPSGALGSGVAGDLDGEGFDFDFGFD